jgi:hypothetical protein
MITSSFYRYLLLAGLVVCCYQNTYAQTLQQNAIATAGGSSNSIKGYIIDFTIGESVIKEASAAPVITAYTPVCTQGFQQSFTSKDFPQAALLRFTGTNKKSYVSLEWTTVRETDNDVFYVEHSTDGILFTVIGQVPTRAPGGSSVSPLEYHHTHLQPVNGNNYYRLRQVNKKGSISYSNTINISFSLPVWSAHAWPNPVKNRLLLTLYTDRPANYELRVVNMLGQVAMIQRITSIQGYNNYTLNTIALKPGMYILFIHDQTRNVNQPIKIIKE